MSALLMSGLVSATKRVFDGTIYRHMSTVCAKETTVMTGIHDLHFKASLLATSSPANMDGQMKHSVFFLPWHLVTHLISQTWQTYSQNTTVFIVATGGTRSCQQLHVLVSILAIFRFYSLL